MLRFEFNMFILVLSVFVVTHSNAAPIGCDGNVDVVFALDSSESILDTHDRMYHTWNHHKDFIKTVIQLLPVGATQAKIATLRFSSTTDVYFDFNKYDKSINIQDAVTQMDFIGGNTDLAAVFQTAKDKVFHSNGGERTSARNVLVVLTDGLSNINDHIVLQNAESLKSMGTEIYTVASSEEIEEDILKTIASVPAEKYFLNTSDVSGLQSLALPLVHKICGLPEPSSTTPPPSSCMDNCLVCNGQICQQCLTGKYFNGQSCIDCMENCDVCTDLNQCELCKIGWYWDPASMKCEVCEVQADLTLLIDNSGSIRDKNPADNSYDNYQLLKDFVKSLLYRLNIGPDDTRVALIRFSTLSILEFTLDQYQQTQEIAAAIDNLRYDKGHTNTSGAIRLMREKVYLAEKGDRANVRNIALIITDGESTKDKNLTIPEAEKAKADGITMFVVGVTDEINEQELTGIASKPVDEHYFNSTEIRHLDSILTQLTKYVCAPENTASARVKRGVQTYSTAIGEGGVPDISLEGSNYQTNDFNIPKRAAMHTKTLRDSIG